MRFASDHKFAQSAHAERGSSTSHKANPHTCTTAAQDSSQQCSAQTHGNDQEHKLNKPQRIFQRQYPSHLACRHFGTSIKLTNPYSLELPFNTSRTLHFMLKISSLYSEMVDIDSLSDCIKQHTWMRTHTTNKHAAEEQPITNQLLYGLGHLQQRQIHPLRTPPLVPPAP